MKKVLSLLLCLCMLLSMVSILSSCSLFKGSSEPKASKKMVKVDLSDYQMVYAADLSAGVKTRAATLATQLSSLTEKPIREKADGETVAVETADLEILVGSTMRVETVKAMKGLGDFGWTIRVFDNKICIVGTNSFFTLMALNYFTRNYLNEDSITGTVISLNQKVTQARVGTVELVEEVADAAGDYTTGLFQFVYDDLVDDVAQTKDYATDANPTDGGEKTESSPGIDKRYKLVLDMSKALSKATGAVETTFVKKDDTAVETEFEILVGLMDREIVREELEKIEANEYGLVIRDGKILVLGWNDVAVETATLLFNELVADCTVEDKKGNTSYVIPEYCNMIYTLENNWDVNFPKPEGENIYLHGTSDVGDDSLEYIYTGSGANANAYYEYCSKLEEAGFAIHGTETKGYNNVFRYYVHKGKGTALYVYYTPYSFATEQQVANDYVPGIRIVASNTKYVTLPDVDILDSDLGYTPICDSTITALSMDYNVGSFGLSYVIRLEDGSFIIFDGGAGKGLDDAEYLRKTILNLYHEVFPKNVDDNKNPAPTKAEPLHVRAWMMTHEHMDHFTVFKEFMKDFGGKDWFRFDYFLFNATSKSESFNCNNPEYAVRNYIIEMQDQVQNGFDYIKVHTGQIFYFTNIKIEILYTHEDTYPKGLEYFNNSSTVFKTTFINAAGEDADTCIWTGDVERIGSRRMRAMWGSEGLKADMVQVAHHGYNGVEAAFYDLVNPTVVWFPAAKSTYIGAKNYKPNSSTWLVGVNHHLCFEISSVKLIVMSGLKTDDSLFRDTATTMTFEQGTGKAVVRNGDYGLYDVNGNGASLAHNDETIIYTAQRQAS